MLSFICSIYPGRTFVTLLLYMIARGHFQLLCIVGYCCRLSVYYYHAEKNKNVRKKNGKNEEQEDNFQPHDIQHTKRQSEYHPLPFFYYCLR